MRTLRSGDDLAPPYAATKAFTLGQNPYDDGVLAAVLLDAGRERDASGMPKRNPSLYPPPTFVALAPLALFRWRAARIVFLVTSLLLFAWHVGAIRRLAGLTLTEFRGQVLLAGVLALAPYHTGIALENLAIVSVTVLVIAIDRIKRKSDLTGGALLGVATLLKPQLGVPFILYFLLRRHARAAIAAACIGAVATALSIGWLALHDVDWLRSWRAVTTATAVPGGPLDPSGPLSAQLIDIRPLLAQVGISWPGAVGIVIAAVVAILIYAWGHRLDAEYDLLLIGAVAVLTLLVAYHRFYDAAVLCLPLAWAITSWRDARIRALSMATAVCCAVFFVPGAWALQVFADRGAVPLSATHSFLWNTLLLRHQNWALVIMLTLLMMAIRRARTTGTVRPT